MIHTSHKQIAMMLIRRLLLFLGLLAFIGCLVLLLNITAPNPTHRRYSSRIPLTTATSTSSQDIGTDGEKVLAEDLTIPSNNGPDQRLCFCKSVNLKPNNCQGCEANYAALTASFRIPDFLTKDLIVESKNRQTLDQDDRDLLSQIGDYQLVAVALHRPLWIYVRVDSQVDPIYEQLAVSTHGGLVRYFNVPGYIDPVDQAARLGFVLSGLIILIAGIWELKFRSRKTRASKSGYSNASAQFEQPSRPVLPVLSRNAQPQPLRKDDQPNRGSPSQNTRLPRRSSSALSRTVEALERAEKAAKQTRDKLD